MVTYIWQVLYKLKDLNKEAIDGSFYEQELQKTTQEVFRIEKGHSQILQKEISVG